MATALFIIELIGVASFSAAGAMIAIDKEIDLFGVILMGAITSFGGGMLREVLRGEIPLFFTTMIPHAIVSVIVSLLVFIIAARYKRAYVRVESKVVAINNILDALGLGIYVAASTQVCMQHGPYMAIILGTIASVGGGLIRDIILGDVPIILRKRIYIIAAMIGCAVYYAIAMLPDSDNLSVDVIATIVSTLVVFAIRICATVFKWNMPKAIDFAKMEAENKESSDA